MHCSDRVLELTFPSPYLRHQPTRLVEHRSDGAIGLRTTMHHVSYEEAFRQELRAFATPARGRGARRDAVEAGRADVALLIDAYRHAVAARLSRRRLDNGAGGRFNRPPCWIVPESFQGGLAVRVGLFTDGLAHLERREALAVVRRARHPAISRWASARGRRARTSTSRASWPSRPSATGCRASCASTGQRLACVNAAGNPLHPRPAARAEAQARAARGDRARRAARRRPRRDDERLPRRPRRGRLDRRVRRLLAVLRRRAALGVAVPRARRALLARALGLGRDGCARACGSASSCTPA